MQQHYRIDCECKGTGRIKRYIGHPGRIAIFVCFACTDNTTDDNPNPQQTAGVIAELEQS